MSTASSYLVFPTQVGMFLECIFIHQSVNSFPHAGGDVSMARLVMTSGLSFSPRRWGCFCGPRPVLPSGFSFPHAGGDVSATFAEPPSRQQFSPRRWGCFQPVRLVRPEDDVFPTQVGMFPNKCSLALYLECFPHAGGDVSGSDRVKHPFAEFSPRRWGCFPKGRDESAGIRVFPT